MGRKKFIIFGTGKRADLLFDEFDEADYEAVEIWDNNESRQGTWYHGVLVKKPGEMPDDVEVVVIASIVFFDVIYKQLVEKLHIDKNKVDGFGYFRKQKLLAAYDMPIQEKELREVYEYMQHNPVSVFPYDFVKKYENFVPVIEMDEASGLFYTIYQGKKMYFSRTYDKKDMVCNYYKGITMEQDMASPHCYAQKGFEVQKGDIVIDGGVAEGNFALSVIDLVEKIYLFEVDPDWIEALTLTFAPWKEKVEIIPKFLCGKVDDEHTTIDAIIGNGRVDFIKLDIEGAEPDALKGASQTLKRQECIKITACTYHHTEDARKLENYLNGAGFKTEFSKGYMFFMYDEKEFNFRKGLIMAEKAGAYE